MQSVYTYSIILLINLMLAAPVFSLGSDIDINIDDNNYPCPDVYGYNQFQVESPSYSTLYENLFFYRSMEWQNYASLPEFYDPVTAEESYYCHYLWRVTTSPGNRVVCADYFAHGHRIYHIAYFWHDSGVVVKMYYQYTNNGHPYRVCFYDNHGMLSILEIYNYEGILERIVYPDEDSEFIRGDDNNTPYYYWNP